MIQISAQWGEWAQEGERQYGVPASDTLAQFIVESGAGRWMPKDSNNPFGIKAIPGSPYAEAETKEVINGHVVNIVAKFAKFPSLREAFLAHALLFHRVHLYAPALIAYEHTHNADDFVRLMAHWYATAPNYADVLIKIMHTYDLYRFNLASGVV